MPDGSATDGDVGGWADLVSRLAAEPGASALTDSGTAVIIWNPAGGRLVWATPGHERFVARVVGPDGSPALPSAGERLRVLREGLAPTHGFRLERLWIGGVLQPATAACRLVRLGEQTGLLTAFLEAGIPGPVPEPAADVELPSPPKPILEPEPVAPPPPEAEPITEPSSPRRPRRFVWRAGSDGRFLSVSDELSDVVGRAASSVVGYRWDDLVNRLVLDPHGVVGPALAAQRPFSRAEVAWYRPETHEVVPVELSGTPIQGEAGDAAGHRGFGTAYPLEARPAPDGMTSDLPDSHPEAGGTPPAPAPARRGHASHGLGDALQAAATLTGTAGDTVFGVLRAWFHPQLLGESKEPARPAPAAGSVASSVPSEGPGLTRQEQGALHEIARALSGTGPAEEQPDTRMSAEIINLPRPKPREVDTPRVLDRLGVAILVMRDGVPVFANRHLLDVSGHEDLPRLVAGGELDVAPAGDQVRLTRATGETLRLAASAAETGWGDLGATILTLSPLPDEAPAAEARALRLDLAQRERRIADLNAALDLASDGVVALDEMTRIISVSAGASRLFGVAENEVVGEGLLALLLPDDHHAVLTRLRALATEAPGTMVEQEVRTRPRGGMPVPLSMRAGKVVGGDGAAFLVAFHDVADARALEDDLREARSAAERASQNRAEFLARVSHEIRTPLTAITGFAELMLEERFGPIGSDRYRSYVRDIQSSGSHVVSLVNDLLDLAKATSGHSDLTVSRVDLNAVARQCVDLSGPLAARERTIIRTSFQEGFPAILADLRSVRQIVLNLLSNALRFTGAGGQVIVSTTFAPRGEVLLSVRDTGPGMTEQEIDAALTPFRQVPNTRRGDGTGLGLPLSKALVEANGGRFSITSAPEMGTLIEVRFAVAEAETIAAE